MKKKAIFARARCFAGSPAATQLAATASAGSTPVCHIAALANFFGECMKMK